MAMQCEGSPFTESEEAKEVIDGKVVGKGAALGAEGDGEGGGCGIGETWKEREAGLGCASREGGTATYLDSEDGERVTQGTGTVMYSTVWRKSSGAKCCEMRCKRLRRQIRTL